MSQVHVCYYIENDILMRKWRPPDVLADDELIVNHQIVVSRAYRPEILNLAHETPMSGHLGTKRFITKFLIISFDQDLNLMFLSTANPETLVKW